MDHFVRPLSEKHYREVQKLIKAKEKYLAKYGFPEVAPVFDNGDQVGVFYHVPTPHHLVGVILRDDENGVTLRTAAGHTVHANPFQLFHIIDPESLVLQ